MYMLEAMENETLKHLYELWILGLFGGWERQSNLDKDTIDELYRLKLIEKSSSKGFVRLSELGVGTVLFGFKDTDKIAELL